MEFRFETVYNKESLTVMAKVLRKTVRKKRSRATRVFGWFVLILGILLLLPLGDEKFAFDLSTCVTLIALIAIVGVLLTEDRLNGMMAEKRLVQGVVGATSVFKEDGYVTSLDLGKTEWRYENLGTLAEHKDFFVFIFDQNHAQLYDKRSLEGGSVEEFRVFIEEKTGKKIKRV
ncbi:MAG: YcxB family protein [Firmicutes bacterium]|nr:YcxB family protein [Bacillota bacterium]